MYMYIVRTLHVLYLIFCPVVKRNIPLMHTVEYVIKSPLLSEYCHPESIKGPLLQRVPVHTMGQTSPTVFGMVPNGGSTTEGRRKGSQLGCTTACCMFTCTCTCMCLITHTCMCLFTCTCMCLFTCTCM